MPALRHIFLSVLLLTVASRVKGNSITVTLFDVSSLVFTATVGLNVIDVSAIDVEPNGGTAYVEKAVITITSGGSPVTTTKSVTLVEAASWLYLSSGIVKENCTLGANGTTAECVEMLDNGKFGHTATVGPVQVIPSRTLTVTGPIPTKSSAATILDNPIFNRLASFFLGIPFIFMLF